MTNGRKWRETPDKKKAVFFLRKGLLFCQASFFIFGRSSYVTALIDGRNPPLKILHWSYLIAFTYLVLLLPLPLTGKYSISLSLSTFWNFISSWQVFPSEWGDKQFSKAQQVQHCTAIQIEFSNFSCRFLNPNNSFQFEL